MNKATVKFEDVTVRTVTMTMTGEQYEALFDLISALDGNEIYKLLKNDKEAHEQIVSLWEQMVCS